MKFAAFTTVASSAGEATDAEQMIDNLRQQTVLAEELGFEAMWLGEHHFGPYGIGDLPNPILLGADLAARTSRIRIGQMANIAPWWHPDTARRRPRDPGQHDRRARGRGLRQGYLAVRRAAVPPQRGPAQGRREPGAVQGDGRGGAGDMDQRVLFVPGDQLQLSRRGYRVFAPEVPVEPRLAGRGPGDEAEGDAETPPEAAPAAVDDGLHGPVGDDGGGDGAEGVLLAAAGSHGSRQRMETVRADQDRAGGEAVRAGRGPGGDALDVRRLFDGGGAPGRGRGHHVRVHLQRPVSRQAGLHQPGRGAGAGREAGLGLPGAAHAAGGFPRQRGGEDPGARGSLQPRLPDHQRSRTWACR